MPKEKECFREQMERLETQFPCREAITLDEACKLLNFDRRTLLKDKAFPTRKLCGRWIVPKVLLARYLS